MSGTRSSGVCPHGAQVRTANREHIEAGLISPDDGAPFGDRFFSSACQRSCHHAWMAASSRCVPREPTPSAAIIDSQSVKTTEQGGLHGYDGGKKVNGRKRHSLVDTLGLLLQVVVHPANLQDREGAKLVLAGLSRHFPRLRHLWADQASTGPILDWSQERVGWTVEIVERSPRRGFVVTADGQFQRVALPATFEPLPRRWVVERQG